MNTIKNPIQEVTDKLQFRAIGLVFGSFKPVNNECLNKGKIKDRNGSELDVVVLGKALPLIKKYVKFDKNYFWIVYPRNKNSESIHFQISGIWDPTNFDDLEPINIQDPNELLRNINLKDNLFSIRGKLIFINKLEEELIIKICSSKINKNSKNNSFKILVKGVIPMKFINSFVSINATRKNKTLFMDDFEIIESKDNLKD